MATVGMADLVGRALATARVAERTDADEDWDEYGRLLWEASADGPGAERLGTELIGSADPVEREAGCDLLGNAADRFPGVRTAIARTLTDLAGQEHEPSVLARTARALGSTDDRSAVPVLVALARHPDDEVRLQVATAFPAVDTGLPDGPDVRALITLSRDEDPEVRNWATFSLGFQLEVDTTVVRAALWERTTDAYEEARAEGIHGLARRHDPRAVPMVAELLHADDGAHVLTFEAAAILGAPELVPYLEEYEPGSPGRDEAMAVCDPVRRGRRDHDAWALVRELHRLRPDLDAAVHADRFHWTLRLSLAPVAEAATGTPNELYSVEELLVRADGDPVRAAALVIAEAAGRP